MREDRRRASHVLELIFLHAEEVAELVEDGEADFLAEDFFGGAAFVGRGLGGVGFDIFLVEDDASGLRRHVPESALGARDADEFTHEEVFVLGDIFRRALAGREILNQNGDVGEQRTIFRRERGDGVGNELVELFSGHLQGVRG